MAKIPRREFEGAFHHIYGRGNRKQPVFADDDDCRVFLSRVLRYREEHGVVILAYCLMVNHYHFVVESRKGQVSRFMKRLTGSYTRLFNDRHRTVGHLFQGPFGNRVCSSDSDVMGAIRYVHLNPVEAKIALTPEDWKWSSHGGILAGRDAIVDAERALELFGGIDAYREFMARPARHERPSIEEIARKLFGADYDLLASASRKRALVDSRRDLIAAAMLQGHRPTALARYLNITPAAVTYLLKSGRQKLKFGT